MRKQTAVQWVFNSMANVAAGISNLTSHEILEQGLSMEKEQIVDACNLQRNDYRGMPTYNKSGEQYYNETYGGTNE
jgi:hypothetical protein